MQFGISLIYSPLFILISLNHVFGKSETLPPSGSECMAVTSLFIWPNISEGPEMSRFCLK